MKTIVRTIATATLALGLFGTPAFAAGGRGTSYEISGKSAHGMKSEAPSSSIGHRMAFVPSKSGPVNR